jgi:hypothetical protein
MIGRRSAALLCVLLAHVLIILSLMSLRPEPLRGLQPEEFSSEPITLYLPPPPEEASAPRTATPRVTPQPQPAPAPAAATEPPAGTSGAITLPGHVDWPLEGKKSAARVLAREAEAERVAKLFAGPQGTWASLTKRQRSKLNKFRWRPGVTGLEYDDRGNQIYHLNDGCVIVNSGFIACAVGKVQVHGDMFENMREYFDEQRLPETNEGNGTEPEALRPPY